ncbi:MAG TPA: M14 family zinc carboxypeptidase [Vicinamibacteria bacterium]|nr:M14 family zinc carboxypeptidase [Vicinamibacteria bacterium]
MSRRWAAALLAASLPATALAQPVDAEYTRRIREYTTDPMFLTELVDHLPASATVPTPEKFHGYVVGTPERLTYAKDVHRYFRELARTSPRVRVWTMGTTEEGREQILVAISDVENLGRLDRLKQVTARLGDPRGLSPAEASTLVEEGLPVYWATGAMHSPETGSPEMLMEMGYRLAVAESPFIQAIRRNSVVLLTPVLEVDGRERMVDVYRYRKDNPSRTPPSLLYWGKYVAHDNNRDGMGLALKQSQNVMRTTLEWHPTVIHDLHESVPFLYTSTGTGPYNAWVDPIVVDEWHQLAYHEVGELTRRGVPGVWTHGFYDGWAPNYMFYAANGHNAIGRFYETFGNGGADTKDRTVRSQSERTWYRPNPPLPKVRWSLRNNVNLQQSALLLAMKYVADNKGRFLENFYLKSRRSVEKPFKEGPAAYVIPADEPRQAAVAELLQALSLQGVEVHRTTAAVKVKERARDDQGQETEKDVALPAASHVVRMDQPYSRMADMLLDTQWYSVNDPRPYDDTGWTLGALHGVKTVRVSDTSVLKAAMTRLDEFRSPGGVSGEGSWFLVGNRAEGQLASLRFRLREATVQAAEEPFTAAGHTFRAGTLIVSGDAGLRARLDRDARELGLPVLAVAAAPAVKAHPLRLPRIALVHDWINTQNEGWWRIAFDRYGVPYDYISVHDVRGTADLRARWDVILYPPIGTASVARQINGIQTADAIPWTPSERYPNLGGPDRTDDMRGGFGYEGLHNLRRFVEEGGLLIAAASSAVLPVRVGLVEAVDVIEARGLQARGSVLRAAVSDPASPVTYGYGDSLGVYFNQGPVLEAGPAVSLGGARRFAEVFGPPTQGRVTGRGGPHDPDVPQGRAYVAPPARPAGPPASLDDIPEEILDFVRNQLPSADRLPRVVMKFAKKDDLWISGMLDKGEELAEKPAVVDCPVGKGHVLLFAINPMWRWQTHGSHALVFNAVMNWDQLGAGRAPASEKTPVADQTR